MEGTELVPVGDVRHDLSLARDPNQVLAEAQSAARALQQVIRQKPKPVMLNGEQYIEFEDWQVLGRFYGVTAKIVMTEYTEINGAKGFVSRAEAIDATGRVISAAEAMVLNDEDKWSTRSKYDWKDGKKVKVGDVPVPLFQLRSMAQTRAAAKCLRNVLAWVVVLAGFKPLVAEEMTGNEETNGSGDRIESPRPKAQGNGQPAEQPSQPGQPGNNFISEAQRKRFFAIWKGAGKSESEVKAYLKDVLSIEHSAEIPRSAYDSVCAWAEKKG
jgi:hypothetical protein